MRFSRIRRLAACALAAVSIFAYAGDEDCRVAFDLGSSGVRGGTSLRDTPSRRVDVDFLKLMTDPEDLDAARVATIGAIQQLANAGAVSGSCAKVGGGFSVWRIAARERPQRLADVLDKIHATTGVGILVIPQVREGRYGYEGARALLGEKLSTSHVLDIGGGSLQIAAADEAVGVPFGQKTGHRELCRLLNRGEALPCALSPLTEAELDAVRSRVKELLAPLTALKTVTSVTAISRPVTRGVLPAVGQMAAINDRALTREALTSAIARMARGDAPTGAVAPQFAGFLLSDMLLSEGVMAVTGLDRMEVAEIDLSNVPGLLTDQRAFAWSRNYACYLVRLRLRGEAAYDEDPATCH